MGASKLALAVSKPGMGVCAGICARCRASLRASLEEGSGSLAMTHLHVIAGSQARPAPVVRKIAMRDLWDALAKGIDDFRAFPTHVIFLSIIYPIIGLVLAGLTLSYDLLPLLFPLAAGFALVGPFAAIGLYELILQR